MFANQKLIPITKGTLNRNPDPWWAQKIKNTIKIFKNTLNRYRRYPCDKNLVQFKRARAQERRQKQQSSRNYWRRFTNELKIGASVKEIWNKFKSMTGKCSSRQHCIIYHTTITDEQEITEIFANFYLKIYSDKCYTESFKRFKEDENRISFECQNIDLSSIKFNGKSFKKQRIQALGTIR